MEIKGLSRAELKTIAIVAMLADHFAWGFLDFYTVPAQILHVFGRLTLPIMCFFIAEGYRKTLNLGRYILRMGIFALISVVPFYLFFHKEYAYRQNIIFDLLLGLLLLTVLEHKKLKKPLKVLLALMLFILSAAVGGWPVMPMVYILIFYYRDTFRKRAVWFCTATVLLVLFLMGAITLNQRLHFSHYNWLWYEKTYLLGFVLALPLLKQYNSLKGQNPFEQVSIGKFSLGRYFFYLFYPAHFLLYYGILQASAHLTIYAQYIALQLLAMAVILWLLIKVILSKQSKAQSAALFFTAFGFVYSVGFFLETTAQDLELAYGAVTIEYIGECAAFIGFTMFISQFCRFKINRFVLIFQFLFSVASVAMVFTSRYTGFFYRNIAMDYSGPFPRLALERGTGFVIFAVYLFILWSFYLFLLLRLIRMGTVVEKKRAFYLILAITAPWVSTLAWLSGLTNQYEVSFVGLMASGIFAGHCLLDYGYFDSAYHAGANALYHSREGILVLDPRGQILYFNRLAETLFPSLREYALATDIEILGATLQKEIEKEENAQDTSTGSPFHMNERIYELHREPLLEKNYVQGYIVRITDYTEHYFTLEEVRRSAHTDSLTGLSDREQFKQEVDDHLKQGKSGALFMIDIDFFKRINDTYGHKMGDEALLALSRALNTICGQEHLCCRSGGDEFLAFFKDLSERSLLATYARQLNHIYKTNIAALDSNILSSLSIGIMIARANEAMETPWDITFETLYQQADNALYITKNHGRNGYFFHDSEDTAAPAAAGQKETDKKTQTPAEKNAKADTDQSACASPAAKNAEPADSAVTDTAGKETSVAPIEKSTENAVTAPAATAS